MTVTQIHDEGQTLSVPRGKVLGIADTRAVFDEVAQALRAGGFEKIEALWGQDGVNLLKRIHTFFFSDMEDRLLASHIEELKAGHIIMLIDTPTDRVDEAVRIASGRGAPLPRALRTLHRHLAHEVTEDAKRMRIGFLNFNRLKQPPTSAELGPPDRRLCGFWQCRVL